MKAFIFCLTFFFVIGFPFHALAGHDSKLEAKVEMLQWEEVNVLLPKYAKFTVIDVMTGKKFKVQRRAGNRHADVQPLTTKDTKIMKEIYNGKWSWKRRAIIIIHEKQKIAASMHGMPHGDGALKNNFPGHFCIHFYGSTTHRRNFMDLSHKLMILKASGELEHYLQQANPYEVVSAFIAGIKEDDEVIVNNTVLLKRKWKKILESVDNVAILNMPMLPAEDLEGTLSLTIPIEMDWHLKDLGRKRVKGEVSLVRFSPYGSWKIDGESFIEEQQI